MAAKYGQVPLFHQVTASSSEPKDPVLCHSNRGGPKNKSLSLSVIGRTRAVHSTPHHTTHHTTEENRNKIVNYCTFCPVMLFCALRFTSLHPPGPVPPLVTLPTMPVYSAACPVCFATRPAYSATALPRSVATLRTGRERKIFLEGEGGVVVVPV